MPMGQSDGGSSSAEILSSQVCLELYQADENYDISLVLN